MLPVGKDRLFTRRVVASGTVDRFQLPKYPVPVELVAVRIGISGGGGAVKQALAGTGLIPYIKVSVQDDPTDFLAYQDQGVYFNKIHPMSSVIENSTTNEIVGVFNDQRYELDVFRCIWDRNPPHLLYRVPNYSGTLTLELHLYFDTGRIGDIDLAQARLY